MTPRQIELVQSSFRKVLLVSDTTAELFYGRLFAGNPDIALLFKRNMNQQRKEMMYALGAAVAWLKRFESVAPSLEALAQRHTSYGVKPEHYDRVGESLLWSLEQALGESFDEETAEAWHAMYAKISGLMKEAAYRPGRDAAENSSS